MVSDLLLRTVPSQDLVLHLENPVRQPWADLCAVIERNLGLSESRLPYAEWLSEAASRKLHPESLHEFFKDHFLRMSNGRLVLDTQSCRDVSPTLRSRGGVGARDIELYLDCWKRQGFLA